MSSLNNIKAKVEETIVKVNGDIGTRHYTIGKVIGRGAFATVFEFCDSQKRWAAKMIEKSVLEEEFIRVKIMSEIKIHRSVSHENIVQFEHFFENSDRIFILLELCPNGTLLDLLTRRKRLTELETKCIIYQISQAVQYLHSRNIIHRDLKLGNLFLSKDMQVKLGDFGLATKLHFTRERKRTVCGTPNYMAPEILSSYIGHSFEVDVWSIGVIAYSLLFGVCPFDSHHIEDTYRRIRKAKFKFDEYVEVSEEMKDFIREALNKDPEFRPNIQQVLEHPIFDCVFPKFISKTALVSPPSQSYLKKFSKTSKTERISEGTESENKSYSVKSSAFKSLGFLWISKWIDFSSKFGLVYLDGWNRVGICFNDQSQALMTDKSFYYIDQKHTSPQQFEICEYPTELKKKVKLLKQFKDTLAKQQNTSEEFVYVKKYVKTPYFLIIWISNQAIQVKFNDKSELVLHGKVVWYASKRKECRSFKQGDVDLPAARKRVKYVKDWLVNNMRKQQRASIS